MNEQINIEALSFNSLGLPPALLQSVESKGYKIPSPIQAQTIPILLEGSDVIGQAQTGTGKTAAFALPLLSRLKLDTSKGTKILVLAPTRELAMQVSAAFKEYSSQMKGVLVSTIYGGQGYRDQISELKKDPQVVVGTPGRVIDHINKGYLKLGTLSKKM
jgi:ATP-dependent RNA helicase DeaD